MQIRETMHQHPAAWIGGDFRAQSGVAGVVQRNRDQRRVGGFACVRVRDGRAENADERGIWAIQPERRGDAAQGQDQHLVNEFVKQVLRDLWRVRALGELVRHQSHDVLARLIRVGHAPRGAAFSAAE